MSKKRVVICNPDPATVAFALADRTPPVEVQHRITAAEREALEALIDRTSLHQVLFALSGICHEKAEHIRSNWQDPPTATVWDRHGFAIDKRGECARMDRL